jgi:hypothetical protein
MPEMFFLFSTGFDAVDVKSFGVEQVDNCMWDLYPRPTHAHARVVDAAYFAHLVVLEEV